MKILSILGSPRSGKNSASIANRFTETAASLGADIQYFELNRLTYRGCVGCYACKKDLDHCILNDDLTQVLDAVHEADLVVLSSPVYFGDVTSQLKGFIDRSYSFLTPEYMTGRDMSRLSPKKLVFVLCQGHPDESLFADIYPRYEGFLKWMGFTERRLIRACGYGPLTVDSIPEKILKQAEDAAREMLS
jgi:multimeric flavodoxin WrbA